MYKGSKRCSVAQRIQCLPKTERFLQRLTGDQQVNWSIYQDWETIARSTKLACLYGATRDSWVHGWSGPEGSWFRVQCPNHRDTSPFHNSSAAAGLLSQRLASQEGKTGACKFWTLETETEGGWNEVLRQNAWLWKNVRCQSFSGYSQRTLLCLTKMKFFHFRVME